MASSAASEVAVYIDGFNLYNGLKHKHGRKYLWLDLESVARRLLRPDQQLVLVRYFTAPVRNDPPAQRRQATYLGALRAATAVDVVFGRFQKKRVICYSCRTQWRTYEEKETDVSIAIALLEDGVKSRFDTALLISADSDLCPSVRALKRLLPEERVIAVFPPKRRSDNLRRAVDAASRWVTQSSADRCCRPRSSTAPAPSIAGQRVGGVVSLVLGRGPESLSLSTPP